MYIGTISQTICHITRYFVHGVPILYCYFGSPIEYVKFMEFAMRCLVFLKKNV